MVKRNKLDKIIERDNTYENAAVRMVRDKRSSIQRVHGKSTVSPFTGSAVIPYAAVLHRSSD
jgi:hypothetical protein